MVGGQNHQTNARIMVALVLFVMAHVPSASGYQLPEECQIAEASSTYTSAYRNDCLEAILQEAELPEECQIQASAQMAAYQNGCLELILEKVPADALGDDPLCIIASLLDIEAPGGGSGGGPGSECEFYRVSASSGGSHACYTQAAVYDDNGNGVFEYPEEYYHKTHYETTAWSSWSANALSDATWTLIGNADAGDDSDGYDVTDTTFGTGESGWADAGIDWNADAEPARTEWGGYDASATVTATASFQDPDHPEWAGQTRTAAHSTPRVTTGCQSYINNQG